MNAKVYLRTKKGHLESERTEGYRSKVETKERQLGGMGNVIMPYTVFSQKLLSTYSKLFLATV